MRNGWMARTGAALCILGAAACQGDRTDPVDAGPAFELPTVEEPDDFMTPVPPSPHIPATPPSYPTEPDLRDLERPGSTDRLRDMSEFDIQRMYRSPRQPMRVAALLSPHHPAAAPRHGRAASLQGAPTDT
jgi:hypothetical protein